MQSPIIFRIALQRRRGRLPTVSLKMPESPRFLRKSL